MKILLLACVILLSQSLFAQKKNVPDNPWVMPWGKVDPEVLTMKTCSFDPDAEAVVLFDVGTLECNMTGQVFMDRHIRIKILREKGLERANFKIPYHSYRGDESIRQVAAQTFNIEADGKVVVTPMEKKSITEKPLNKRFTEMAFALPAVKVGSVIEIKYTLNGAGLRNWYFQNSIPVQYSQYTVDFPSEVELMPRPHCSLPLDTKDKGKVGRTITQYSMQQVPALRDEPYIMNEKDYMQRLDLQLLAIHMPNGERKSFIRTWPGIVKELMEDEDFGKQLNRNIPRTEELDRELQNQTDPFLRMKTIHQYVSRTMEWNGYTSIWALDGVRAAWNARKGTSGEINLILVNLLRDAGLDASPVLVSTHENGSIDFEVPSIYQFNKVLAYVKMGENRYVLDASDKVTPCHLIPQEVLQTHGLVIDKLETKQWGWQKLIDDQAGRKNSIVLKADITEEGVMSGQAYIASSDYEKIQRTPVLKKDQSHFINQYYTGRNESALVKDLVVENVDHDSLPLLQRFNFERPVNASGDYHFFTLNLFTGLEKNPFLIESRFSDVFFGSTQYYSIVSMVTIPKGYQFEELPRSLKMILPDSSVSLTRIIAADKEKLSVRVYLELRKPFYTTEEYPDFREFYKQLFEMLNEQFVYRKTAIAATEPK